MSRKMRFVWLAAVASIALAVSGCNTLRGVGQDIQKAGSAIEDAVKKK